MPPTDKNHQASPRVGAFISPDGDAIGVTSDRAQPYERTTAPQSEYARWTVIVGALVFLIGVALALVVPILFV